MFFVFPYWTNAPIYQFPFATVGLIVLNTIIFGFQVAGWDYTDWMIIFGDGLHPLQWVTAAFLHGGPMHLIGNMVFLWAFGLVVEGKVGWWRFLAIYFLAALGQGFLTQLLMLGAEENFALGASGAIYGLLAICLIWAPKNDFSVFILFFFLRIWVSIQEVQVMHLTICYLALQLVIAYFTDFTMGSEVLHLLGASVGFPIGIAMLKKGLVDCEGWDFFSVMAGRHEMTREEKQEYQKAEERKKKKAEKKKLTPAEKAERRRKREEAGLELLRNHLAAGNTDGAIELYNNVSKKLKGWDLPEQELKHLIDLLFKEKRQTECLEFMAIHMKQHPTKSDTLRIHAANILIQQERPKQALSVLNRMYNPSALTPDLQASREKMLDYASKMRPYIPEPDVVEW